MSVFDRQGPALPGATASVDNSEEQLRSSSSATAGNSNLGGGDLMDSNEDDIRTGAVGEAGAPNILGNSSDNDSPFAISNQAMTLTFPELNSRRDARSMVRLVQCTQCSLPLRQPLTLTCGNSICRNCLPATHKRENITYPMTPGRLDVFPCPCADCETEHPLAESNQDVTLAKVLDKISIEVARTRPLVANTPMLLDERPRWRNVIDSSVLKDVPHSRILSGGRLIATYTMAELGELAYSSELSYTPMPPAYDTYTHLDLATIDSLRTATRSELDCNLCYALLLDPVTIPCGHTYCRKCVARVLDHSQLCPECRRPLHMPPAALGNRPANKRLSELLLALCPEQVTARAAAAEAEEAELAEQKWVPLFVCTLAYPQIPTFLRIFEPRYRLMIRRAMETDRTFGMLAYNARAEPQGELGPTQFMRYGTMLEIVNLQLLPDGQSLIETRGVSRFCVEEHDMRDGYIVGRVSRVDDISIEEEEALEASEVAAANETESVPVPAHPTGVPPAPGSDGTAQQQQQYEQPFVTESTEAHVPNSQQGVNTNAAAATTQEPPSPNGPPPLNSLPTSELLRIGTSFVERMHAASAPWLSHSSTASYGAMPSDPAIFPYWFASVLPIDDGEKYRLLMTRSVRKRLEICAEWVRRVERMRWFSSGSCIVL